MTSLNIHAGNSPKLNLKKHDYPKEWFIYGRFQLQKITIKNQNNETGFTDFCTFKRYFADDLVSWCYFLK